MAKFITWLELPICPHCGKVIPDPDKLGTTEVMVEVDYEHHKAFPGTRETPPEPEEIVVDANVTITESRSYPAVLTEDNIAHIEEVLWDREE